MSPRWGLRQLSQGSWNSVGHGEVGDVLRERHVDGGEGLHHASLVLMERSENFSLRSHLSVREENKHGKEPEIEALQGSSVDSRRTFVAVYLVRQAWLEKVKEQKKKPCLELR
jgi:hypothetical protein